MPSFSATFDCLVYCEHPQFITIWGETNEQNTTLLEIYEGNETQHNPNYEQNNTQLLAAQMERTGVFLPDKGFLHKTAIQRTTDVEHGVFGAYVRIFFTATTLGICKRWDFFFLHDGIRHATELKHTKNKSRRPSPLCSSC